MGIKDQMAELRARLNQPKPAAPKPRVKYSYSLKRWVMIGPAMVLSPVKPASNVSSILKYRRQPVKAGERCKHCRKSSGIYVNQATGEQGKCYVCHGDGRISVRDEKYDQARWSGKRGPVCDVASA